MPPFLNFVFSQRGGLSGRSGFARSGGRLRQGEAETNLATLGSGTGFALGALFGSFVGAKAADFLENAVHFETGFETLESAVNRFAFADLNFGHIKFGGGGKRDAKVGAG